MFTAITEQPRCSVLPWIRMESLAVDVAFRITSELSRRYPELSFSQPRLVPR